VNKIQFSVFTKPWPRLPIPQLAGMVAELGFDGIEFPVRDGYQIEPGNAEKGLPAMAEKLAEYGLNVTSVAGDFSESLFAGCHAAGIGLIRAMARFDGSKRYMEAEDSQLRELEAILPMSEKYGVMIGVQHHYGNGVSGAMELRHLLERIGTPHIRAIWDAAHSALAGETPGKALSILWDYLCLVNLKTAFYRRVNGPEAGTAVFEPYFTRAPYGNISWEEAVSFLREMGYEGTICMPAEYTDEQCVAGYISQDLRYAKDLVKRIYG
jgi:sugar phosphate isomerase/epimerase